MRYGPTSSRSPSVSGASPIGSTNSWPSWPTAEHRAANPVLDEATLTAAVGTETARVLHSAHEVAGEMVANAEAEATRLLTECRDEIERLRAQTESRLSEQSAASEAAAEELRERTDQSDRLRVWRRRGTRPRSWCPRPATSAGP